MADDGIRYELRDRREIYFDRDPHEFDRIAFAMRVLRRLAPKRLTVALYRSRTALDVQRGTDFRTGGSWALVGIPADASRAYIAYSLAELVGVDGVPYAVQTLLADDRAAYR